MTANKFSWANILLYFLYLMKHYIAFHRIIIKTIGGFDMGFDTPGTGDFMFTLVPLFIVGVIIFVIIRGIAEWSSNNQSPRLTVPAIIVTKRTNTSRHHHGSDYMHSSSSTTYYVTFQFESGDRTEFAVKGTEYGMLAEEDTGLLTFQGTRYLGFERKE